MTIYRVEGMDCAGCARELEEGISRLPKVQNARVDFMSAKLYVEGSETFEALQARAQVFGKTLFTDLETKNTPAAVASTARNPVIGFFQYLLKRNETKLALVGGGVLLAGVIAAALGAETLSNVLFVVATAVAALPIARSGVRTLFINRNFNINLLMTIAAVGAIAIGELAEAATVVFLFAVGEALEGYTADRARNSLRGLLELAPQTATRIKEAVSYQLPDASFQLNPLEQAGNVGFVGLDSLFAAPKTVVSVVEEVIPVMELALGDRIVVKPGERIPMDGVVVKGGSGINQAPITGESIPVYKTVDAEVYAGTVNGDGALEIRVTHLAVDNTLNRIIVLVEEAQSNRAPSQRLIDSFAQWYTPGVVVLAALVALVPPMLFNAPFYNLVDGTQGWLYRALELLVIACPCSLVISTPVTIISAITAAARHGVLIKGGAYLESLGGVSAIAFDKTGTLTRGQPVLTQMRSVDCATGLDCELCDDVLALAASVEERSTHPLAKAVVYAAGERGLHGRYTPAEDVTLLAGRGLQGRVGDKLVTVGSHALFEAEHPHSHELCRWVESAEANGQTAMLLCDGDRVRGFIAVADEARPESQTVVADLKALGLQTVMLTGDNAAVAQVVGQKVGVDDVRAGLLPADKVAAVKGLLHKNHVVAMVGDGVNDTPALAAATVGVAMGGAGSAQALETADIALMADDLRQLPYAVRLARFARGLIRQNISLSIGLKLAFMALALAGGASLWLAVFADVGMSLLVTLNGMRPVRYE